MKTKQLIEELTKADPTGEEDVAIAGHTDILCVYKESANSGGPYEILLRDSSEDYYDVIGVKLKTKGTKITIVTHSAVDAIYTNPDIPIDISEIKETTIEPEILEKWNSGIRNVRTEAHKTKKEAAQCFLTMMENWYSEYSFSNNIKLLEKYFGGFLNKQNTREDVLEFLEKKLQQNDNLALKGFIENKIASW